MPRSSSPRAGSPALPSSASRRLPRVVLAAAAVAALAATGLPAQAAAGTAGPAPGPAGPSRPAAGQELSTTDRLQDRREVTAGTRAYAVGFQDGRFYANGWHITGEMGGIWTPPVKLLDGLWFGVDGRWVGPATRFTSGWGYTRYDLPDTAGLQVSRTDVVPDGRRAVLFGLTLRNPGRARTATLTVDAHSELLGQYPWGFTGVTPNAADNLPDRGRVERGHLLFSDDGALPGAPVHHYAAAVGAALTPGAATVGPGHWGPQPGHRCTGTEPGAPADPKPVQCDDGPFGRGTGGRLSYRVALPAGAATTVWVAVAGSDGSPGGGAGGSSTGSAGSARAQASRELAAALRHPERDVVAKLASRRQLAARTTVRLPGDPLAEQAVGWAKQNLADLTQQADDLQVRWTDQGTQFPAPSGTVRRATWVGAGFPDYPWIFATDAEYTAFASVAVGQFEGIEGHLRTLQAVSDLLNHGSGVVAHETVADGSVWFGHDSRTQNPDGTTAYDFNTDETVKFPSALALVWRWTGDDRLRDDLYGFAVRNLRYVVGRLDSDHDGWPEGLGNVERSGMGAEKLDNAVYLVRGLYDLADLAASRHDRATQAWAQGLGSRLLQRFDPTWWDAAAGQYADSLTDPGNVQSFQKHWIGQTPMEAELTVNGRAVPGIAPAGHAGTALAGRENSCFSGERPFSRGLFHTGCGGGPTGAGERTIFGLTTSIQSVGEGNAGRLGPDQQGRYLHALAETMVAEPATGGTPDEQPGAMPEIFPSPDQGPNIDRCWTCRSMVMQAWGHYGTVWPVVHQWLGVRPDLGRGRLELVPQLPPGQDLVQGKDIRLGDGAVDVTATRHGSSYRTEVDARCAVRRVALGVTLPAGSEPTRVLLDGRPARPQVRTTSRGVEVTVTTGAGRHVVTVEA